MRCSPSSGAAKVSTVCNFGLSIDSARSAVLFTTGTALPTGGGVQLVVGGGAAALGAVCPPQESDIASNTANGPNERTLERYPDTRRRSIDSQTSQIRGDSVAHSEAWHRTRPPSRLARADLICYAGISDELRGFGTQVAPDALRGPGRTRPRCSDARQRNRQRPRGARLPVHRRSRRR